MTHAANTRNQPCPVDPDDLGSVRIEPQGPFPVAATGTWTLTYTAGRLGIDDSGAIIIVRRIDDGSPPQATDPKAVGYVTATTDADARLEVRCDGGFWVRPWRGAVIVTVRDGSLRQGETITVTLGDARSGSPGWRLQTFPEPQHHFGVLADAFGTGEFYWLAEQPAIEIVPGDPADIELVLPSLVEAGQPVRGHVRVCDAFGNPVRRSVGSAAVTCDEAGPAPIGLPVDVELSDGVVPFGSITFGEPGDYRLSVRCGDLAGGSNPVRVVAAGRRPLSLYWADMHGQTAETVGTGTVEQFYRFARDRALIDVASWQGNDFQVTDDLWREVRRQTAGANEPGRFVTFLGYEWSGLSPAGGDHNVYFLGDDEAIHRSSHWQIHDGSDPSSDRYPISELFREFSGRKDVLITSHVGGRYANLDFTNDEFPDLVEVHSHHGTFEWIAEEAVRRGLCVGFVGQSDDHTCRPGLSGPLAPLDAKFVTFDVWGGYTGVYASELTREAIWRALKARHCYVTTGRRIVLAVRCGEAMMGDLIAAKSGQELTFDVEAMGHGAPIADLEIRRGNDVVYRHAWPSDAESPWIRLEWSGVRVRGRIKTSDWTGRIVASAGTIDELQPYGFTQAGQGVTRAGESELAVRSVSSGNTHGVLLRLSDPAAQVTFESAAGTFAIAACDATPEPRVFPAGGVNQQVRVSRMDGSSRTADLRVRFSDVPPGPGRYAYWVRLMQADAHMAWSSPLFVDIAD